MQYQGQEFDIIALDEATQIGERAFDVLADKTRRDVSRIAAEAGYALLEPDIPLKADKWYQQIAQYARVTLMWGRLFFKLHHGDLLLVQYPYYPAKAARIARWALHFLQWKGAKTAAYIHDLDSLRRLEDSAARWSDQEMLTRFDRVIVHNRRMADYIAGQGVGEDSIVILHAHDHLEDGEIPVRTLDMSVCVAGDLRRKNSRYLHRYRLPRR